MAAFDMLLHFRHEIAIHMYYLHAPLTFKVKMTVAFLGFVKLIRSPVFSVGITLEYPLIGKSGQSTVDGRFSDGYFAAADQFLCGETGAAVSAEKFHYLIALLCVIAVSVHSLTPI